MRIVKRETHLPVRDEQQVKYVVQDYRFVRPTLDGFGVYDWVDVSVRDDYDSTLEEETHRCLQEQKVLIQKWKS